MIKRYRSALDVISADADRENRQKRAARTLLAALERGLPLLEKADADSGCLAYAEIAAHARIAIAMAKRAGIRTGG